MSIVQKPTWPTDIKNVDAGLLRILIEKIYDWWNRHDSGGLAWTTGVFTNSPTIPNGTKATDAAAFGQIYYGFQAPVQTTTTSSTTYALNTFTSATGMILSITPTSASHRIKVTMTGVAGSVTAGTRNFLTIKRGTTNLGDATQGFMNIVSSGGNVEMPFSITYIDSPATTSSTAYTLFFRNSDNSSTVSINTQNNTGVVILEEIV